LTTHSYTYMYYPPLCVRVSGLFCCRVFCCCVRGSVDLPTCTTPVGVRSASGGFRRSGAASPLLTHTCICTTSVAIDYRIIPGSFPNPVVSVGVCYTAVGRCRRRLDHGMVGFCAGVLLSTSCVVPLFTSLVGMRSASGGFRRNGAAVTRRLG